MLTNAGTLFFTDVREFIPQAKIRMIGMEKGQPIWSKEYEGPIWKCIESVYEDLLRIIKKVEFLKGTRRVKMEEYPPGALREAIINAVSHRNYIINADVRICCVQKFLTGGKGSFKQASFQSITIGGISLPSFFWFLKNPK